MNTLRITLKTLNIASSISGQKTLKLEIGLSPSNESLLKVMKNAFYFILKARFVLKIITFLSWLFWSWGKTAWSES